MGKERSKAAADEEQHRSSRDTSEDEFDENGQSTAGRGWHGNPEGHAAAGSKGGQKVSQNRAHMASIGRKGGQAVSRDRQHMAEIGRKGGQSRGEPSEDQSGAKPGVER